MIWYEEEVKRLEADIVALTHQPALVIYGSSSIRLWETLEADFQAYDPLNLGFGGSTLAACGWFFDRIFARLQPEAIILYAGDNDLGDGRSPEEVFLFFNELMHLIRTRYGGVPVGFISIKPSISRWDIVDKIRLTNRLIETEINKPESHAFFVDIYGGMTDKTGYPRREFLEPDGLHINENGYLLWKEVLLQQLQRNNIPVKHQ